MDKRFVTRFQIANCFSCVRYAPYPNERCQGTLPEIKICQEFGLCKRVSV